jgi:hypothetical protein
MQSASIIKKELQYGSSAHLWKEYMYFGAEVHEADEGATSDARSSKVGTRDDG